ncbi:hypothetical protein ACI2KR_27455 [Pseudomonas luteola]
MPLRLGFAVLTLVFFDDMITEIQKDQAAMQSTHVIFSVKASVENETYLNEEGKLLNPAAETVVDQLYALMINPRKAPLDAGYELLQGTCVKECTDGSFILTVNANVHSRDSLYEAAQESTQECWSSSLESIYDDPSLTDMLYECLVASNSSPSPVDAGYSIICRV